MSKSAKRVAVNNLYYFSKKTQKFELTYDQVIRASKFITRANDPTKTIGNKQSKTLLASLAEKLLASKERVIFVDHDYISSITDCQPEQNGNILKQLADILDYEYHRSIIFEGRRRNYGLIIKFTDDGIKRVQNPELFYDIKPPQNSQKETVATPKKIGHHPEKNRGSYIDKKEIQQEREEEALAYSSSLSKKEKINKKKKAKIQSAEIVQISNTKPEPSPQEQITDIPTLATGYPTEPAKVYQTEEIRIEATNADTTSDRLAELRDIQDIPILSNFLTKTENIPSEEGGVNTAIINQITQLKAEIFKAFDSKTSEEIMENCTFTELEPNKLGISIRAKFNFSEHDKQTLKTCVHMTYGSEIKMVNTSAVKQQAIPMPAVVEPTQMQPNCQRWERFKKELLNYFPEKTGDHILNAWFDKLRVSEDAPNNRIILTGSTFYVDSIYNRFETAIKGVVKKMAASQNKVTLELHYENNSQRPIIYKPNGGF